MDNERYPPDWTPQQIESYEQAFRRWQEITRPLTEATQRARRITAEDLAITINPVD